MINRARNARIVELARSGVSPNEISRMVGASVDVVYREIGRARRDGDAIPYFTTHGAVTARPFATEMFSEDIIEGLKPHAKKRGVHPVELAKRVLEAVVGPPDIINAVLDDGVR